MFGYIKLNFIISVSLKVIWMVSEEKLWSCVAWSYFIFLEAVSHLQNCALCILDWSSDETFLLAMNKCAVYSLVIKAVCVIWRCEISLSWYSVNVGEETDGWECLCILK
jgi:hypothetical protein